MVPFSRLGCSQAPPLTVDNVTVNGSPGSEPEIRTLCDAETDPVDLPLNDSN
jgi:hypothetical protein